MEGLTTSPKYKGFVISKTLQLLIATVIFSILTLFVINTVGDREFVCKKQSTISSILSTSHHKTTVMLENGEEVIFGQRELRLGSAVCQKYDVYIKPVWLDEAILKDENVTGNYLIK